MSYLEMLDSPKIKQKFETLLGGHIMNVYQNAGYTPPIPRLHGDRFIYPDPSAQKYANHLREGMKLFAQALDELNKLNEEKAPE
ncbi:hypothetical protein [Acinetobacter baumannii]|uniref:hypothetical protein n=1 Tax=Acinetobacter baumannii TaxID=470 RepID=UPI00355C654B